ncbi:LytTR family transcriptional regulator [Lentibacter sp. XHP0401]|uniref:LytTR family transcriptional regulator n=1 Tax=Lentibacter sp. XHP0401 TaxID=2984334 RepID=UPI0021E9128D|nr:LytTR family transcriptional regulator [Lentibacter sp. XHP0401]MCV2891483.1 LytTR family transcriptional regulator [Lentibacter sp. XHP0401]
MPKERTRYVKDSPTHSALRELRRTFTSPRNLAALSGVVVFLAVSGPFGTYETLRLPARLAYWAFTAPLTFALGSFTALLCARHFENRGPVWLAPAMVAICTALSVGALVLLLNWAAFGTAPTDTAYLGSLLASVFITAAIIALALYYTAHHMPDAPKGPPHLLQRLDYAKRGPLISLSVQDHYVEVVTTKGASLVLMRLSDAIKETGSDTGLQVHRSHWVALAQIEKVTREGDKARITLKDGRDIPASRSYIPALKEAGLLPR